MSGIYIYSTLTADQLYTNWKAGGADLSVPLGQVFIKGGHGLADKRGDTPQGVVTEVTAEQLELLRANPDFRLHEANGFIHVVTGGKEDPEKVASDMAGRDGGGQLTDADFKPGEGPAAVGGQPTAEDGPRLPPAPPVKKR